MAFHVQKFSKLLISRNYYFKKFLVVKFQRYSSCSSIKHLPESVFAFGNKTAIVDDDGAHSYLKILSLSHHLKNLTKDLGLLHSPGDRIAFLTPNNALYTICQWSIWLNGGIGVPLSPKYPSSELEYLVDNSRCLMTISTSLHSEMMSSIADRLNIYHMSLPENFVSKHREDESLIVDDALVQKSGLIIYTSGTTGRPKGVVHTQSSLNAQVQGLVEEYKICKDDVLLHVLPLHHVHGIVNMLMCPLSCGATVVMEREFDAKRVWNHLLQKTKPKINVFMAVPTIYAQLIEYFERNKMSVEESVEQCKNIRLMISGSSALPVSVLNKWQEITGHVLLERYGMTEIGMGLTNPYYGKRTPGTVGLPFPDVKVQIVPPDDDGTVDLSKRAVIADKYHVEEDPDQRGLHGELLVKSSCMFDRYYDNPKATEESFVEGWFRTGDTAAYENGVFRIVGRTSVDIIKSGGYKISALDLEQKLLNHPDVNEVSVVGVPDPLWGEQVAAVASLNSGVDLSVESLQDWCRKDMPGYHVPKRIRFVDKLPRNVMGKVNKKQLIRKYFDQTD